MDQVQDIKNLISGLDIPEGDKQGLLDQLAREGASKELFASLKTHIEQAGQQVKADLDAIAAEQKKIADEYGKKIDDEVAKLEQDINPLEKELDQASKDAEKKFDQLDMEDARDKIASS